MSLDLTGSPRIDQPWIEDPTALDRFGPWHAQARQMHEQGFCLVDLAEPELLARCDAIIASIAPGLSDSLERWRRGDAGPPRRQDAWQEVPEVRALALHPAILDLLAHLYGRSAFAFQTLNFAVGSQQHFHSDAVHFHSFPHGFMCGVWFALEDIHPDSGPLVYYPGSHRLPYLSAESLGLTPEQVASEPHPQKFFEPHWRTLVQELGVQPSTFLPRKGQALVWHANLLHGGRPVADRSTSRWSQVVHYLFDHCLYTTPMHSHSHAAGGTRFRNPYDLVTGRRRVTEAEWRSMGLTHPAVLHQARSHHGG
jgi:hypothetical protein